MELEMQKLAWLHSGLYRLLFGRGLFMAVAVAPRLLAEAASQQTINVAVHNAAQRLDNVMKLVTGAAAELSGTSLFLQWCWQLLLLQSVKELLRCCKVLETSLVAAKPDLVMDLHNTSGLPSMPSAMGFKLQEISWDDLRVIGSLGCGSFGAVFSAWWKGALVAVKCIELGLESSKQQVLEDMEREARMMAVKNSHPNVVRFLAICREKPAIIMELCTAGSVDKQIQRHKSVTHAPAASLAVPDQQQQLITPLRVIKLLHDAAAAMDYLHTVSSHSARSAVLHCDLRSPNLLLAGNSQRSEEWSVRIADFGLAQWVGTDGCTHTDRVTNHLWVAPEVLDTNSCKKCVSRAADVYAFGAVMWEVLTGKMPHVDSSMTPREVALLGVGNPYELKGCLKWPSSKDLLPGLDCSMIQQLRPLFDRCISKDAQARPSFEQIQHELAGVLAEAQAALAPKAAAGAAAVNAQADGGAPVCCASLGPCSQGSIVPLAPTAAAAARKADVQQYSSPFVGARGAQCFVNSSVLSSPFAAGDTLLKVADGLYCQ